MRNIYQHPRNLMGMTSDVHGISSVNGNAHLLWGVTPKLLEGELLKLNRKKSPILKARKNREIIFRGQKGWDWSTYVQSCARMHIL